MSKKIIPFGYNVVIDVEATKEKSDSGLFIPDAMKDFQLKGTVIAVGEEVKNVKVGDNVFYAQGGMMTKHNDKNILIIPVGHIIGKFVEE